MCHLRAGLSALAFSLLSACGGDDQAQATQFEISGHVLDARTAKPIAHAQVDFSSDTLDVADTDSDDDGHFSFQVTVRDGVLFGTITAAHTNYQAPTAETVYFDDLPHVITLELQPKPASK